MLLECLPTRIATIAFRRDHLALCVPLRQLLSSLRDVELMMAFCGVQLSDETIRRWVESPLKQLGAFVRRLSMDGRHSSANRL